MSSLILNYPGDYKTPSAVGTIYKILEVEENSTGLPGITGSRVISGTVTVVQPSGTVEYNIRALGDKTFTVEAGVNSLRYDLSVTINVGGGSYSTTYVKYEFSIAGVDNKLPLAPYSIQSVIDRVLELQEPLLYSHGELETLPRFKFDLNTIPEDKRELFTRNNAPEFTFTRCTVREALQIIGGFIHAEPRLLYNAETQAFDTVTFDFFGVDETATYYDVNTKKATPLKNYPYEDKTLSWNIEQGCNELDAHVENLVNRMGANATTAQPFNNGYQTLRTETSYIRFEDEEGEAHFPTDYPVYDIKRFLWQYDGAEYDLTPYIYEQTIYNSQLSSYGETYPTSKGYGLYYKMGEKGIRGFFFKKTALVSAFQKYAIVNIIKKATGKSIKQSLESYLSLQFRLEYTPIYSARMKHSKTYVEDWLPQPRTLNYSQSDNMVETQYFGENIKGAVERYGTLEKLITFVCRNIDTIPKAGQKFDEDYYIATVAVEVMHDRFKVTCGLSKRFNRLSKYVGLSTYKRIYEISERMTQTRDVVWDEYVVFGESEQKEDRLSMLNEPFWVSLKATLVGGGPIQVGTYPITGCMLQGFTKNNSPLNSVVLPIVASAIGNTIEFSCAYKDNFSAGQRKITMDGDAYATEVEYADYYGRLYYLQWNYGTIRVDEASPNDYPLAKGVSVSHSLVSVNDDYYQVLRKDGAEAIRHNVCIHFVADDKKLVIGSSLSRKNAVFLGENLEEVEFIVLRKPIGVFDDIIDENNIVASFESQRWEVRRDGKSLAFTPPSNNTSETVEGVAWALITKRSTKESIYQDEDGNEITATETSGGELLIGKNESISAGVGAQIGTGFTAFGVHDIYKYLKNKN